MGRSRSRGRRERRRDDKETDDKRAPKRSRSEESAERSREREKRRRRAQREFMQKHGNGGKGKGRGGPGGGDNNTGNPGLGPGPGQGGPVQGGGIHTNPQVPPKGTGGVFWDGFQWIQTDAGNSNTSAVAQRRARRLYVGNLPKGGAHGPAWNDNTGRSAEQIFRDALINKMREELIIGPDRDANSIELQIWFHQEQQYGFLECETVEQAQKVLVKCDGMLVLGSAIQIRRPTDNSVNKAAIPGLPNNAAANPLALTAPAACTSRIIQIAEALVYDESQTQVDDFAETLEDMLEGCGEHAKVNHANSRIIQPEHMSLLQMANIGPDGSSGGDTDLNQIQIGYCFLECGDVSQAATVLAKMQNRKYDNRLLRFASFPESKFLESIVPLVMNLN